MFRLFWSGLPFILMALLMVLSCNAVDTEPENATGELEEVSELLAAPLIYAPAKDRFELNAVVADGDPKTLRLFIKRSVEKGWDEVKNARYPASDIVEWSVTDLSPGTEYPYAIVTDKDALKTIEEVTGNIEHPGLLFLGKAVTQRQPGESFRFALISDTHLRPHEVSSGLDIWAIEEETLLSVVKDIEVNHPDFIIHLGDVLDFHDYGFNDPPPNGEVTRWGYLNYRRMLTGMIGNIAHFMVIGNWEGENGDYDEDEIERSRSQRLLYLPGPEPDTRVSSELPKDRLCPDVYDPVEYGPEFNLGTLPAGTYDVYDKNLGIVLLDPDDPVYIKVGSFSVASGSEVPIIPYSIQGRVIDNASSLKGINQPIQGVKVYLRKPDLTKSDQSVLYGVIVDSTHTDIDGKFLFTRKAPDYYSIECLHQDYNSLKFSFYLESDTSFEIRMAERKTTVSISGHVRELFNGEMQPLEGCTIAVRKPEIILDEKGLKKTNAVIVPIEFISYSTVSGPDGSYEIKGISVSSDNETLNVSAIKKGYATEFKTVKFSTGSDQIVDFILQRRYTNYTRDTVDGVIVTLSTEKEEYIAGEGVSIRYTLTNTTSSDVVFEGFSMNCEYDMEIGAKDAVSPFYKLSDHISCIRMISEIVVPAKDSLVKEFPKYVIAEELVNSEDYETWYVSAGLNSSEYRKTWKSLEFRIRKNAVPIEPVSSVKKGRGVECNLISRKISLNLPEGEFIRVTAYTLDGRRIPQMTFQKRFGAGLHLVPLDLSGVRGMCLLTVSGARFSRTFKLNLAAR